MSDDRTAMPGPFSKGSAILAAALAMTAPAAASAGDDRAARSQRLEDDVAICALHRDWLARVNAGDTDMAGLFVHDGAAPVWIARFAAL